MASFFFGKMGDPLRSNCLSPRTIVMSRDECFYCYGECKHLELVSYLYGLKSCDLHHAAAKRDCNAWLQKENCVRLTDARKHPIVGKFLDLLDTPFSVQRSSGVLEEGWQLQPGWARDPALIRVVEGDWTVHCVLYDGGEQITKYERIENFLGLGEIVLQSLAVLEAGFYMADYTAHMEFFQPGNDVVEDDEFIKTVECEDGSLVRVVIRTDK
jgi:hypothetical protein